MDTGLAVARHAGVRAAPDDRPCVGPGTGCAGHSAVDTCDGAQLACSVPAGLHRIGRRAPLACPVHKMAAGQPAPDRARLCGLAHHPRSGHRGLRVGRSGGLPCSQQPWKFRDRRLGLCVHRPDGSHIVRRRGALAGSPALAAAAPGRSLLPVDQLHGHFWQADPDVERLRAARDRAPGGTGAAPLAATART
jgi:hypothetical protein